MKKHTFATKDEKGNWLIRCPFKGGSFSSKMWKLGNYPHNQCPCCRRDVRTEYIEINKQWIPKGQGRLT